MSNWHDPDDPMFPLYFEEFIYNDDDKKRRQEHDHRKVDGNSSSNTMYFIQGDKIESIKRTGADANKR